jgi:hypothetical protein
VTLLLTAGIVVEVLHVAVNVSYVYYREGYISMRGFTHLFVPETSQLAAHWAALCAWDGRVDMWLVNVARQFGAQRLVPILIGLLWWLSWCVRQVSRYLLEAELASVSGPHPKQSSTEIRLDAGMERAQYGAR